MKKTNRVSFLLLKRREIYTVLNNVLPLNNTARASDDGGLVSRQSREDVRRIDVAALVVDWDSFAHVLLVRRGEDLARVFVALEERGVVPGEEHDLLRRDATVAKHVVRVVCASLTWLFSFIEPRSPMELHLSMLLR